MLGVIESSFGRRLLRAESDGAASHRPLRITLLWTKMLDPCCSISVVFARVQHLASI